MIEIVAEAGTAHNGDLGAARELCAAAFEAGAGVVKFQYVIADEIIHPNTGTVNLPGGPTSLYERFRELERPFSFYEKLKSWCDDIGIEFFCTPFGPDSARALVDLGVSRVKLASPELNHAPLLGYLKDAGRPVVVSTGVSRLGDIEAALEALGGAASLVLHCVTAYPAPEGDYNLRLLPSLSSIFGLPTGVSDHSTDPLAVPVAATAVGAAMIEKHVTLSRRGGGLDDPVALEPADFAAMVAAVRAVAATEDRLSAARDLLGRPRLETILGDGRKHLAPSERENYGRTNRSIHARTELAAGTTLEEHHLCVVRTEKTLRPGLSPFLLPQLIGVRLQRDVPAGEGIQWGDILSVSI